MPVSDFFGNTRSTNDIGAPLVNSPGTYNLPSTSSTYTDPWGNVIGAGLTVTQGSPKVVTLTTTQMSSALAFQSAVNSASPGDILEMPGGNYTWSGSTANGSSGQGGGALLTVAGTASNWIIIRPQAGATVNITGSGLGTTSNGQWLIELDVAGAAYVDIEGINTSTAFFGFVMHSGTHWRVYNCSATNMGNGGIYVGPTNSTVGYYEISYSSWTHTSLNYNSTTGSSGWNGGITMWGDHVTCMYNLVTYSNGEGIDPQGDNQLIYGNTVYMTGRPAIYNWGNGYIVVESNFVYQDQANQAAFYANVPVGGINDSEGISMDNEGSSGSSYPLNYLTVRNNIVWGATHGISFRNYDNGSGMVHARWENNTVHGGQTGTNNAFEIDAASSNGAHSDVVVANNIGAWTQSGGANWVGGSDGQGNTIPAGVTLQYNNWYNVTGTGTSQTGDVNGNPGFHG